MGEVPRGRGPERAGLEYGGMEHRGDSEQRERGELQARNLTIECDTGQGNALYINGTCPGWTVRNCRLINSSTSGSAAFKVTSTATGDTIINNSISVGMGDGISVQGRDLLLRGQRHHEYRDRGLQRHHHQRCGRDVRQQRDYGCLV